MSTVTVGVFVTAGHTLALTTIRQLGPIRVNVTQSATNLLKFRAAIIEGRLSVTGKQVKAKLTLEDGSEYDQFGILQFVEVAIDETVGTTLCARSFPIPKTTSARHVCTCTLEEDIAENSFLVRQPRQYLARQ